MACFSSPRFSKLGIFHLQYLASLVAVLLVSCASGPPRNSSEFVEDIARHAQSHRGQLLASGGQLLFVRQDGATWILRIVTQNYRHLFEVRFPLDPGDLRVGQEVAFLGTLQGTELMREAYSGEIILVQGLALKPVGGRPIIPVGQDAVANLWLSGRLDLTVNPTDVPVAALLAAPTPPVPASAPRASASAGTAASIPDPGSRPSPAVVRMLRQWAQLSEAERADFLQRASEGH